jgi:hypothetical protein
MRITRKQFAVMLWVAVAVTFFLGGSASAITAFNSPVGQWDFTVTGAKKGTAFLEFGPIDPISGLAGVSGYVLVIPGTSKGGADGVSSYGFAWVYGMWQFDSKGKVVAYLYNNPAETVRLDVTSFTGKVNNNFTKFTATGQTEDGKLSFSGVQSQAPVTSLPNVWTIEKKSKKNVAFTEIFIAETSATGNGNLYGLSGEAANLCISGYGAVSKGNNFYVNLWEAAMPDDPAKTCADVDFSTGSGIVGSAAIGKIKIKTDGFSNVTGQANLSGVTQTVETSGKPAKITMPVYCQ